MQTTQNRAPVLYAQTERYRRLSVPLANTKRDLNREHQDIMDAALSRDQKHVRALMVQHLELTTSLLLQQSWAAEAGSAVNHRKLKPIARAA